MKLHAILTNRRWRASVLRNHRIEQPILRRRPQNPQIDMLDPDVSWREYKGKNLGGPGIRQCRRIRHRVPSGFGC